MLTGTALMNELVDELNELKLSILISLFCFYNVIITQKRNKYMPNVNEK